MTHFLNQFRFDIIFDVGANTGQFATELRDEFGYGNRIISFEPLSVAFEILNRKAKSDSECEAINSALGSRTEESTINIAGNSASSSLLEMLPKHIESAPHTAMVSAESVDVKRLDDIFK